MLFVVVVVVVVVFVERDVAPWYERSLMVRCMVG